ncbi:MAG: restriction endonuclease subunit S [Methanosarcinaceae archaeon]
MEESMLNDDFVKFGWKTVKLGDFIDFVGGGTPDKKNPDYWNGDIKWASVKDVKNKYLHTTQDTITELGLKNSSSQLAIDGELILVTRISPGKCVIAKDNIAINQDLKIVKLKADVLTNFVHYFFTAKENEFIKRSSGTTVKGIRLEEIRIIEIDLPPLPEQRAIVSKIEQLFSELDNGIANLKLAQEQLKVYRQAVLKKAFEGELTKKWREQQSDLPDAGDLLEQIRREREEGYNKKLEEWKKAVKEWEDAGKKDKKPTKPKKSKETTPFTETELSNLPKGWGWIRLGNLVEEPKYGTSKKCDYNINGIGVLRIPNISDGLINDSDLKYAQFDFTEIENYRLKTGDILTIRSNGSVDLVGKCALVSTKDEKYLYAGYLIRLRPISSLINSKYLLNCLSSIDLRYQIESKAKSTSGVNNINSGELQSLKIPICTPPEQQFIVQEIETRLSVCDKIEQDIETNLDKAEALRQSILKKAFEGKLLNEKELAEVRLAEDWEPAEVLLERVKAEKKASGKKGKS